jgi:hypothetical protein
MIDKGDQQVNKQMIARLSEAFVAGLRQELTPAQWALMAERNRSEQSKNICHSHDFTDANMVMSAAFEQAGIPLWTAGGHLSEQSMELWNAAWAKAAAQLR